jgi:hypothetical protein
VVIGFFFLYDMELEKDKLQGLVLNNFIGRHPCDAQALI